MDWRRMRSARSNKENRPCDDAAELSDHRFQERREEQSILRDKHLWVGDWTRRLPDDISVRYLRTQLRQISQQIRPDLPRDQRSLPERKTNPAWNDHLPDHRPDHGEGLSRNRNVHETHARRRSHGQDRG